MFKLSPRRNQRNNKGFKVKHALHICVLGGVCIWLLYQLQHSRNKTATYDDSASGSKKAATGNRNGYIKLGRKDLDPRIEEMTTEDLKNGGQDAEEGKSFDDDNNKAAEIEQDQEKVEESEPLNRQKDAEEDESNNEGKETAEEESRNENDENKEQKGVEQERAVEEENKVGKGEETEKLSDSIEDKGESNKENGSEEKIENGGKVKEVEVEENNEKSDARTEGEEKQESKEKNTETVVAAAAAENGSEDVSLTNKGNTKTMNVKEQGEPENSPKNATNHGKKSLSGSGSKLTQVKNGKENNLKNAESLGGTGKTSLVTAETIEAKEQQQTEDNSNPMTGKMEAKEQQQVDDKSVTDSTQTENGSASLRDKSNAVGNEIDLVDNSNTTVGSKDGNEQQQEHDNTITGSTQTRNKPVDNVDSSGDGGETVPKEQTDSSDANSSTSSTNGESTSNSTSGEQSSVLARQTEMNEGLTKQILDADSGSGEKFNLSNDDNETTNPGENNSIDSSNSQNEESSSGSTRNPNGGQQNQHESSSSVLQEEADARTDLETMPQTEITGNNREAAE